MKVLQIMPDFEVAGAQVMCTNLATELNTIDDVDVRVCSFFNNESNLTKRLKDKNVHVYYLGKKKGFDFFVFKKLYNLIEEFEPDIIHTHRYSLQYVIPVLLFFKYVKRNNRIRIVHTIHSLAQKDVMPRLLRLQKKWFKKGYAIPVAISPAVKESIVQVYNLNEEKIPIIFNGVPISECIKKDKYYNTKKIIHVGRFSEEKNHSGLLEVFKDLLKSNPKAKLYLIGDGHLFGQIKNLVRNLKLNDNVVFLGKKDYVYSHLHDSDVFVLPSKYEGMPMSLLEAMATGLPVVCSPVGGIPDMIDDGVNGFLPKNKAQMVKILNDIINDKKMCEKIGKSAIEKSKDYSSKKMAKSYLSLYKDVIL